MFRFKSSTVMAFFFTIILFVTVNSCIHSDYPSQSTPPGPGFYELFNGTDFTGWNIGVTDPEKSAWSVQDGIIHCMGEWRDPYLIVTEKSYENFDFYAEFKVSKDCNSGIFFHVPLSGRQSRLGFEAQVLDDHGKEPYKGTTGAIYDVVPPLVNAMKPAGKWNQYRVLFDWPMCKIWLNGTLVQDTDFSAHPKLKYRLRCGPIGLSNHGHIIDYRNLWIKELPDKDTGSTLFNGQDLSWWTIVGDADWHVKNGVIMSTRGEGYLVTDQDFENFYFHAYVENDTLNPRDSCFYYRWKSVDDPGYPVDFYDHLDAEKYTAQYADDVPDNIIRPLKSSWLLYRIISADRESQVYLNEHLVSDNRLLGRSPRGKIAIYRSSADDVIRIKDVKLRPLN